MEYLFFILALIIIYKLNQIKNIMASAEETLDAYLISINQLLEAVNTLISIIEEAKAGSGDLTSTEVTEKMSALTASVDAVKTRLEALANSDS